MCRYNFCEMCSSSYTIFLLLFFVLLNSFFVSSIFRFFLQSDETRICNQNEYYIFQGFCFISDQIISKSPFPKELFKTFLPEFHNPHSQLIQHSGSLLERAIKHFLIFLGNFVRNEEIYKKWYFVTKIVLTYCEKKMFQ